MSSKLQIALVDDDENILNSLKSSFSLSPDFEVIYASNFPEQAAEALKKQENFILITDIEMPEMNGIELIRSLASRCNGLLPLVFTIHEDRKTVFDALKAGAYGYILKGSPVEEIFNSVTLLANGGSPMSPAIARKIMTFFHETPQKVNSVLSKREMDVLKLVDQALTYKEISESLKISPNTVHVHIKNIYEKLHASNRAEALKLARERKYI